MCFLLLGAIDFLRVFDGQSWSAIFKGKFSESFFQCQKQGLEYSVAFSLICEQSKKFCRTSGQLMEKLYKIFCHGYGLKFLTLTTSNCLIREYNFQANLNKRFR